MMVAFLFQNLQTGVSVRRIGKKSLSVVVLAIMLLQVTCRKNPTGPQITPNVQFSLDYVTCTEVWFKLGFEDSPGGGDYRITRDGATTITSGTFSGASVTVYDSTVEANKSYAYTAYRLVGGDVKEMSPSLQVTTLDSTSHDFNWQAFVLGDGAASTLNDVAVINDTLIYAVGNIELRDSTGQFTGMRHNVGCWNGTEWKTLRLRYFPPGSIGDSLTGVGTAIFAPNPNDIWLVADVVYHFDGVKWSCFYNTGADGANRIWGDGSGNLWLVGNSGMVVYKNGDAWTKLGSGTSYDFENVWGANGKVFCVTDGAEVMSISASTVTDTKDWPGGSLRGLWFADNSPVYVAGQGIWKKDARGWLQMSGPPSAFFTAIRGNGVNDLIITSWGGNTAHYNGSTWKVYGELSNPAWALQSVAINHDVIAAVGFEAIVINGRAVVAIGIRRK